MKNIFLALVTSLLLPCLSTTPLYGQCNDSQYSTNAKDSWVSCQKSTNPNTTRPISHWLKFDLGYVYPLDVTHFWNYNIPQSTGQGFKQVAIDYSLDGTTWTEAGTFQLPEASGTTNYTGSTGLDLTGITARYILITALSNWDGNACAGISEVRIAINPTNQHCGDYLVTQKISGDNLPSGTYYSPSEIETDATIQSGSTVTFQSATAITFEEKFTVEPNSEFLAIIANCNTTIAETTPPSTPATNRSIAKSKFNSVVLYPNPTERLLQIEVGTMILTDISIISASGHEIMRRTAGQNLQQVDVSSFPAGMYFVNMINDQREVITKRFVKKSGL